MRKLITSFFIAFLLLVTGTSVFGQAAGDFVFQNSVATDSLWATQANWGISDGAGNVTTATRLPGATDNVWIKSGSYLGVIPSPVTGVSCGTTTGSTTITIGASNSNIVAGMVVRPNDGNAIMTTIQPGTYVVSVSGTTIELSKPVLRTYTGASLSFFRACKNLTVDGRLYSNPQFAVCGDITVNAGAIVYQNSDLYCKNIINRGNFRSTVGWRSHKTLYLGYDGAIPGNGDYSIVNDGIFGSFASGITIPAVNDGSGIALTYSNQANSVTIKKSSSSVTGNKFNISWIQPTGYIKTEANTTLNIQQSMSVMRNGAICLSVQNNDSSLNTTRTCNIDPGVTVYVGSRFHTNAGVTTAPQGNVVYNVYGTLDLGTYCTQNNKITGEAGNVTEFSLCMSSVTNNAGSLTFNLGDGTQANAGTLVLGSNVKLIKQRTQNMSINFKDYSTVTYIGNYGWTMNYQLLNDNTPAMYLFPKSYYNLTLNGTSVVLPATPTVRGSRNTIAHGYAGVTSWAASANTLTAGSIIKTSVGKYYYIPYFRGVSTYWTESFVKMKGDTLMKYIQPNQAVTSTGSLQSGLTVSTVEAFTSDTVKVTLSNATQLSTTNPAPTRQVDKYITFTGRTGTTEPTGTSTNTFDPVIDGTLPLIYLGDASFVSSVTTSVKENLLDNLQIYSNAKNILVIDNATVGDIADVYSVSGMKVASAKLMAAKTNIYVNSGIYIVKINNAVAKVAVK